MTKKADMAVSRYPLLTLAIISACTCIEVKAKVSQPTGTIYGHQITIEGTPEIKYVAGEVIATVLPISSDLDSDSLADWRYVWQLDGAMAVEGVAGGTTDIPSFVIPQEDFNKPVMLCLYAQASSGYPELTRESQETCSAPLMLTNTPPVASNVSVTGTLEFAQTLRAHYLYADAEEDSEGGTRVQWYRADDAAGTNRAAIAGAISKEYVAVGADLLKYVAVEVTPVASTGVEAGVEALSDYLGPILSNIPNWSTPNGVNYNFSQANSYCNNLSEKGHTDWRLPTEEELIALYELYPNETLIRYGWPINNVYWSSTPYIIAGYHNSVSLSNGSVHYRYDSGSVYIVCVR